MSNEPKSDKEKRSDPGHRQNAHGDHDGSAHDPEVFDVMDLKKTDPASKEPKRPDKKQSNVR